MDLLSPRTTALQDSPMYVVIIMLTW
jgi:hypothetical protein